MGTFSISKTVFIAVFTVSFFFLFARCGIDSYPYLSPPSYSSIREPLEGESVFQFKNNTENNANYFEGFEIYYKFYSSSPSDSDYDSDTSSINLTPTKEKLESLGYKRLYEYSSDLFLPLIPVEQEYKNDDFTVIIDFSSLDEIIKPYPKAEYLGNSINLARYVSVNNSDNLYFKSFRSESFQEVYSDLDSSLFNAEYPNIYLSLYVLSYGKYDIIYDLYSKPVSLGKIVLKTYLF